MFGAKRRQAREIAHEVLKPLGLDTKDLKETSRVNFEADMRRVVDLGKADELYHRQSSNRRDEAYDDRDRFNRKRNGR